ncbi:uncharacterized protein PGTG_12613 [Puccinia graminis f. sp. tritici CRL 75-36-700-3]|uniref:Uncharacterized protein n=1 Tax=Puccinia graminis f. sp. tritici (strain CRL 75-36-700-3 / race SCCL) TaxID=418459 RepID=E3KRE7_PUCGT|nr:uncharacterized protein PGTG_12613 [Puccinia graminis f. sp. tritici CRL 75-36-700-3]EFP86872.1 hypothetical protein PGTG_12613 [Puccinia graminis f. sp. tritici CRL 75-36-700-3]
MQTFRHVLHVSWLTHPSQIAYAPHEPINVGFQSNRTYESRQEPSDHPVQFGPRPVQLERPHGPGNITTQDPAALKRSNSQHPAAYERSNSDQRNLVDPAGDWDNACWDLGDPTANFQEVHSSFVPPVPEDISPLPLAPVDALQSAPAGTLALDNFLSSNMQAPDVAAHPEQRVTVGITTNHLDPGTASPGRCENSFGNGGSPVRGK